MREAILRTLIPGLIVASVLGVGLSACGGDDAAQSQGEAVVVESSGEVVAQGSAATEAHGADGEHPVVLAQGEEIEVTDYLDEGNITIIDFYSEFCPPCRRIEPYLVKLHQEREDITVVKIDINRPGVRGIDWGSPVARQYRLQSVPHFLIYDGQGRLLAEGREAMGLLQGYMEGRS